MIVKAAYRYVDNGDRKPVALIQYLQAATKPGEQPAIVILRHLGNPPEPTSGYSAAIFSYPGVELGEWASDVMPPTLLFGQTLTRVLNPVHLSAYTGELDALASMTRKLQATADDVSAYEDLYKVAQAAFVLENAKLREKIDASGEQRDTESLALRTVALALHQENPEITDFGGLKITTPLELVYNADKVVLYILNQVKDGHMDIRAAQGMLNLDKNALKPAQKAIETFHEAHEEQNKKFYPPPMFRNWPIYAQRAQNTLIQWKRFASDSAQIGDRLEALRDGFRVTEEESAE